MNGRGVAVLFGVATAVMLVGLSVTEIGTSAHHLETTEFDRSQAVTLTGEVVKFEWINPHPWIHINVSGEDEQVQEWMVEAAAPMNLLRRGFKPESLSPGAIITIDGYQSKDHSLPRANGRDVTFTDGRKFFLGSSGTGAPEDGAEARSRGGGDGRC